MEDNGIGFTPLTLEQTEIQAFGLGFVRGLVKSLDGTVTIKNKDPGTQVICSLPIKEILGTKKNVIGVHNE